jgi:hypothetical protein
MARPKALYFDPYDPPVVLVPLAVARVQRYSRQLFQISGHVGDYEVAICRPAAELPQGPMTLTGMQVTRLERFAGSKMVQVWGYVGDYEASIALRSDDDRVSSLKRLHKLGQQLSASRTGS